MEESPPVESTGRKADDYCTLELYDPRADRRDRYRPLEPSERLYPLAAATYRIQDILPTEARRALLYSLAEQWPKISGRARHRDARAAIVHSYYRRGWSIARLARQWGHDQDEVRRWLKHAERVLEEDRRLGTEPTIQAVDGSAPTLEELERVRCSDKEIELRRADLERGESLHEQLAPQLGHLAPLAQLLGPPPDEPFEER